MGEDIDNHPQPMPTVPDDSHSPLRGNPSIKQQSWGTVISIIIIVAMIIIGAFYAWGKRVAENKASTTPSSVTNEPTATTSTSTVSQ